MQSTTLATVSVLSLFLAIVGWIEAIYWYRRYLKKEKQYQKVKNNDVIRGLAAGAGSAIMGSILRKDKKGGGEE